MAEVLEAMSPRGALSMQSVFKIPLVLTPQPEGGFTVTSPVLPELVTEGDRLEEVLDNVRDAVLAVLEIYQDRDQPFPTNLRQDPEADRIWFEYLWSGG